MDLSRRVVSHLKYNINVLKNNSGRCRANAYHAEKNPQGVINLGTAENKLIENMFVKKINESLEFEPWMQYYFENFGVLPLRKALAQFFEDYLNPATKIDPENLAVTLGCGAAMDLMFYMLTDPGDCVLVPAPYYVTAENDLFRNEVKMVTVHPFDENFLVTSKELEEAYVKAKSQGLNVRAVMIINPDNPTGICRGRKEIEDILAFSARHDIHTVLNENYALSTFKKDSPYCSILSVPNVPLPLKTHFLWGFSKDFGSSGLRCGVIHTRIDFSALKTLFFMEAPPALVQATLAKVISDKDWLNEVYFPTNQSKMKHAYDKSCATLRSIGVEPFHGFNGAFFIWVDFRKVMKSVTKEEEEKLSDLFFDNGAYIIPGSVLCCPFPGWFRITYTYQPDQVELGLERIRKSLEIYRNTST